MRKHQANAKYLAFKNTKIIKDKKSLRNCPDFDKYTVVLYNSTLVYKANGHYVCNLLLNELGIMHNLYLLYLYFIQVS